MDIDEQERIDAVNRYMKGDRPANICREMKRSKKWFFKWLKLFKTGDEGWYRSLSQHRAQHMCGRLHRTGTELHALGYPAQTDIALHHGLHTDLHGNNRIQKDEMPGRPRLSTPERVSLVIG